MFLDGTKQAEKWNKWNRLYRAKVTRMEQGRTQDPKSGTTRHSAVPLFRLYF
jgi:hypothetical protein